MILCAVCLSAVSTLPLGEYFASSDFYKYLAANLSFLNWLHPDLPGVFGGAPINGALWTIKVEVSFYIALPVMAWIVGRGSDVRKAVALATLYLFGCAWYYAMQGHGALQYQLPGMLNYFAAGMALIYFEDFWMKHKNWVGALGLAAFVAAYSFDILLLRAAGLAGVIFFVAHSFRALNGFGRRGDFSYGVYIFHFPIIMLLREFGWFEFAGPWLGLAGVSAIVMFIAVLSWNFIEKPFLRRAK